MAGVNKAIIVGNLGNDPDMRNTQTGTQVANFSIATSENFTDSSGQKQERTEWHRIVAFGRLAEICGQYLHKGKQVYVEGRIQTRKWEDKSGQARYTTEIVANQMQMLGRAGDGPSSVPAGAPSMDAAAAGGGASGSGAAMSQEDDDLPF